MKKSLLVSPFAALCCEGLTFPGGQDLWIHMVLHLHVCTHLGLAVLSQDLQRTAGLVPIPSFSAGAQGVFALF